MAPDLIRPLPIARVAVLSATAIATPARAEEEPQPEVEEARNEPRQDVSGESIDEDVPRVGVAWARPYDRTLRDEYRIETFSRLQLAYGMQVTPVLQVVSNPAWNTRGDWLGVFGLRSCVTV